METDNLVEFFSSNEVISSLWNKHASEKCRIGLSDIIIFENGSPIRWYVTGKTGEISKKRGVDLDIVSQRWKKISSQYGSEYVAIIRQDGGIRKILSQDAWNNFMRDPKNDPSVLSIHSFIRGDNNMVYRNTYKLRDKIGRYSTSTYSYVLFNPKSGNDNVVLSLEGQSKFTESRANQINNVMDLATNTVVRYMELMLNIKVLYISIDYVIDIKSQIWMLWTSDAKFVRNENLSKLKEFNLDDTDKTGRMSWAGPKYFEELNNNLRTGTTTQKSTTSIERKRPDIPSLKEASVDSTVASTQLNNAINVIGNKELARKAKLNEQAIDSYNIGDKRNVDEKQNNFPNPHKCKGDYCSILIQPKDKLVSNEERDFSKKIFSPNELKILKGNNKFDKMTKLSDDHDAEQLISNRSILLARNERRGLSSSSSSQIWNTFPESPRQKFTLHDNSLSSLSNEYQEKEQEQEALLAHDKTQRENFLKSMANYYEQVYVCPTCYKVYSCLDWARKVLGLGDAYGAGEAKLKERPLTAEFTELEKKKEKSINSKTLPNYVNATQASIHSQRSPIKREKSDSMIRSSEKVKQSYISREGSVKANATWKNHLESKYQTQKAKEENSGEQFVVLDDYLRGGAKAVQERKERDAKRQSEMRLNNLMEFYGSDQDEFRATSPSFRSSVKSNLYYGKVLIGLNDDKLASELRSVLESAQYIVSVVKDGRELSNQFILNDKSFDCVIVQSDLPLHNAKEVTKIIRDHEYNLRNKASLHAANEGKGIAPPIRRYPVICLSESSDPDLIQSYIKADMDGCITFPIDQMSLINTVRSAIPHHLAKLSHYEKLIKDEKKAQVYKLGGLGELEGSNDSASMAARTLSVAQSIEDDVGFDGVVQIDADTRVPFMVLDASRNAKVEVNPKKPFFNLIVCHDIFDTAEKMKIFFKPMVQRYLGMQVLLWNYPGQAFTEWREEQLLNNDYLASCFNDVLGQVGDKGTNDFDTSRPFYILGFGLGMSVASFFAAHYRVPNLRGIISVNGWTFLDSYLAGVMHDCLNIFQCAPSTRPDLPVYFFSRFLFSKDYLAKVSVPLALNIYTAVHNTITIEGRVGLCKGVLKSVDLRPLLKDIDCPLIAIHSNEDALARPLHSEPYVTHRGGEVRSIHRVLKNPSKSCIIWMKGGHEIFQENKKQLQVLIEQIVTGFHEAHDISFPSANSVSLTHSQFEKVSKNEWENNDKTKTLNIEDKFINSVLSGIAKPPSRHTKNRPFDKSQFSHSQNSEVNVSLGKTVENEPDKVSHAINPANNTLGLNDSFSSWQQFSQDLSQSQVLGLLSDNKGNRKYTKNSKSGRVVDPNSSLFELQDNPIYGKKALDMKKQNIHDFPEVKEYMTWRLKRNKKRLQRLQAAAKSIQGAFRAYMARKLVHGIRRLKAAMLIQRIFRGWLGRCDFENRARNIWASQIVQRIWRGYSARKWYFFKRLKIAAAANIQRIFRGFLGRRRVDELKKLRFFAASVIQAMFRRFKARKDAWRRRQFKNCATNIQRMFRGHLGRKKALAERDKYIFSRSQSQGIEFGRQMLLEHKLHATKLQSDVTLLTQEKVAAEEQIEALLEEISTFEEGVRVLEKEMHQLSKVESEASAFMDEDSKYELREQKMKLDREFGEMLNKIGSRKDMLNDLEKKLSTIDKSRQAKEEELRTLERKLVVLLEEQQNELNAIKRKQDVRGAMLAASHDEIMKMADSGEGRMISTADSQASGSRISSNALVVSGGGGGGGGGGPSLQEKKQAAQLMQSTETLMKFGFMSMSMTYFSSLNMIKALRTVSAQDTVMAALADVHSQRSVGYQPPGEGSVDSLSKSQFLPDLKKGQLPGQQVLKVSAWSVDDVAKWLQTLSLGQYVEAFIDSAIDGEFLYDLNDDDLKNTLGIEHRLHRKKILNCVHRLKLAEAQRDNRLNNLLRESGSLEAPIISNEEATGNNMPANPFQSGPGGTAMGTSGPDDDRSMIDGPKIPLSELFSLVRHSKFTLIKEAIDYLPNKTFDKSLVQSSYVEDFGTVYVQGYERLPFHLNKVDEFGNSMLSLACQNGNMKICKYLVAKGANPNHQNRQGQTPAHFAIAYKFFDLSHWLFENGADDTLENKFGLSPYDGLSNEGGEENDAF